MPNSDEINGANFRRIQESLTRYRRAIEAIDFDVVQLKAKIEGAEKEKEAIFRQLPGKHGCQTCQGTGQVVQNVDGIAMSMKCPSCWGLSPKEWQAEILKGMRIYQDQGQNWRLQ